MIYAPHQPKPQSSLSRAIVVSLVVHLVLMVAASLVITTTRQLPPAQVIQVRLVGVPIPATPAKKVVEQEPIRTQDSAAPKEPPPETKDIPESDAKTKMLSEEKPKTEEKKEDVEAKKRPPVLDKTPEKKKVVKNDLEAKVVKNPEDYLNELDFLDNLETENTITPKETVDTEAEQAGEGEILQLNMSEQGEADKIRQHIERFWQRPLGADNRGLSIIVRVELDDMGNLVGMRIVKSSGQSAFDSSLDRAVRKAQPIPLPQENRSKFLRLDLHFQGS